MKPTLTLAKKKHPPTVARTRRGPYELLQHLKEQRAALVEKNDKKLAFYDAKIEKIEARYKQRIAVEQLCAEKSPEELEQEILEVKDRQRLLRQAMKTKTPAEVIG